MFRKNKAFIHDLVITIQDTESHSVSVCDNGLVFAFRRSILQPSEKIALALEKKKKKVFRVCF